MEPEQMQGGAQMDWIPHHNLQQHGRNGQRQQKRTRKSRRQGKRRGSNQEDTNATSSSGMRNGRFGVFPDRVTHQVTGQVTGQVTRGTSQNASYGGARPKVRQGHSVHDGGGTQIGRHFPAGQQTRGTSFQEGPSQLSNQSNTPRSGTSTTKTSQTKPSNLNDKTFKAIQKELKLEGGRFLILCQKCFTRRPQRISPPKSSDTNHCSSSAFHSMRGSKGLFHRDSQGNYTKLCERPPMSFQGKPHLCWHILEDGTCRRHDRCKFPHSQTESLLWWLEAKYKVKRSDLRNICLDLSHPGVPGRHPPPIAGSHSGTHQSSKAAGENKGLPKAKEGATVHRAAEVASCRASNSPTETPPFKHMIKVVCGKCFRADSSVTEEQNPKKPSYCTGKGRHQWGLDTLCVVKSASLGRWMKISSRHSRLRPDVKLMLCWKGKSCKQDVMYRVPCMFPHFQEELELWNYQNQHNVTTLKDVITIQQARATVVMHEQIPVSKFSCSFCRFTCTTQTQFDIHIHTVDHKARIFSDADRVWKYRTPPQNINNGQYQLCKENETDQCEFSNSPPEENDCIYAHSLEEQQEWRQRHDYRMMKLKKACEMNLVSWLDNLEKERAASEEPEDVITEDIFGVELDCRKDLQITLEKDGDATSEEQDEVEWKFVLHTSTEKPLKRVGLLYDEHRTYFHLSEPSNEPLPQTCPGSFIRDTNTDDYTIAVRFSAPYSGHFRQWLVFDFGDRPVLVRKLSVQIGSESELVQHEFREQEVDAAELWNESNQEIIPFVPAEDWIEGLWKQYPTPGAARESRGNNSENAMTLSRESYKPFMHDMLMEEEQTCREIAARYRTVADMEVCNHVQLHSFLSAQPGQLFGIIPIDKPLHDDSMAAQLIQRSVQTVLLKCHEQSEIVYEAEMFREKRDTPTRQNEVVVSLSQQCVKDLQLNTLLTKAKGPHKVLVTVQFRINREPFLWMHHAVENLSCPDTVLPQGNQAKRFPEVSPEDCPPELNQRQEQAVRCLIAGGRRGVGSGGGHGQSGPTMILGPFGTGKTHTLAKAVQRILTERTDTRILICTHSNSAADLYITEYLDKFCEGRPDIHMMRIYSVYRKLSAITASVKKYMAVDQCGPRLPTNEELKEWVSAAAGDRSPEGKEKCPNLVLMTLTTAVNLTKSPTMRGYFTHIVIDEAGQALETEALIPLGLATNDTCVVLAGDPRQMNPKVYSSRAVECHFDMSLLQRLYKYGKQNQCFSSCNLLDNYRSCQPILDFLKVHYGTAFRACGKAGEDQPHPELFPLNFLPTPGDERPSGNSYINEEEAERVVKMAAYLLRTWPQEWGKPKPSEIVVLSADSAQVFLIRGLMKKEKLHGVTVETVQNVQGKQYRAVLISTVRTRSTLNKIESTSIPQAGRKSAQNKYWYGFLSDKSLLNTAFTRAQSLIVVAGDPVSLCSTGECHKTWERYIKTCEKYRSIYPHLTMAQIQQDIRASRCVLNPLAKVFVPKSAPTGRAIEVRGCNQDFSRPRNQSVASDEEDEDEDEEMLSRDEWLQELREMMEEEAAGESETEQEAEQGVASQQEEIGATGGEPSTPGAVEESPSTQAIPQSEQPTGVWLQNGPRAGSRQRAARRTVLPLSVILSDEDMLRNVRAVEREGHYSLIHDDNIYDSDDEDDNGNAGQQGQSNSHHDTVDDLLRMTYTSPDVFKICTFHQSVSGFLYAVPHERESGEVISITSRQRRGHALNNDKVVVEIIKDNEVQEGEAENERDIKIYGKVRGVIERSSDMRLCKMVCYLDPQSDNVMVPIDRSCPKMLILAKGKAKKEKVKKPKTNYSLVTVYNITKQSSRTDKPCRISREETVYHYERAQKLFVVRYLEWPENLRYPLGAVTEVLEPGNTPKQGLRILKLVHGVKDSFKKATRREIQQQYPEGWQLPDEAFQGRQDLRGRKIFTIDPPDTDLDDAVSLDRLPGERYHLGVHIADVSFFVPKDSAVDRDAFKRGTSFYHPFEGGASHMLPKDLSTTLCSILPGKDRLAVSVFFVLDGNGRVVATPHIMRSVIRSVARLTYEDAEHLITENGAPGRFGDIAEAVRTMHKLAKMRRKNRLQEGWMVYNTNKDEGGAIVHPHAHSLIEEFMVLANSAVAKKILEKFPECTPLRRQLSPSQEQVEEWKLHHKRTAMNSILLPVWCRRSHALEEPEEDEAEERKVEVTSEVWDDILNRRITSRQGIEEVVNLVIQDESHPLRAVALSAYHDIMETAQYVDSTSQSSEEQRSHFSLQLDAYTHFTSPIRRFIDLVVHRMLVACLENTPAPYEPKDMAEITHHCNNQNSKSKQFEKDTLMLKFALKLQEAALPMTTFVESISDSGMEMLLPYRGYIHSRHRNIKFSLLKPSEQPDIDSGKVKVAWKYRMYNLRTKQSSESPAQLQYTQCVHPTWMIPEDKWQAILEAIRRGDHNAVIPAIQSAKGNAERKGNPFSEGARRRNPNDAEMIGFSREYRMGDVCRVQMHAQLLRGVLTPQIQLLDMTPQVAMCTEHRSQPVQCFSEIATSVPGKEKTISSYQEKWAPIASMISACSAVTNDDTIILQNVAISWQKKNDHISGHFKLNSKFANEKFIPIYMNKDGVVCKIRYLCIHVRLPIGKARFRVLEYDRGSDGATGPFNKHDWQRQTYVAHCVIKAPPPVPMSSRRQAGQGHQSKEPVMLPVDFTVHQSSIPFPERLLDKDPPLATTVELIQVPPPNVREEEAVRKVAKAPGLVIDIALQRQNKPDLHSDSTLRALMKSANDLDRNTQLRVEGTTLKPLNPSQEAAVRVAIKNTFSAIQGPPGTGKTVTGAYLAYFFAEINKQLPKGNEKRPQVLYCGPSNKSVDVVAGYLKKFRKTGLSIARVYSKQTEYQEFPIPGVPGLISKWTRKMVSMPAEHADIAVHHLIRQNGKPYADEIQSLDQLFRETPNNITSEKRATYNKILSKATKAELQNHHIVLTTCNGSGAPQISELIWAVQVIVDEAGMCSEPETLIPLVSHHPKQVVLIGDHKQLRSIITEHNALQMGVDVSLLEKFQHKAQMLTIQYRMHQEICKYPSHAFYDDRLQTDCSVTHRPQDPLRSMWPNRGATPRVFCHVSGKEEVLTVKSDEGSEMSRANPAEIRHVVRIIGEMLRRGVHPQSIAVLSQYRLQCALIQDELTKLGSNFKTVTVSTVVKSQGSEWDYVVFSTVRSKPKIEIETKPGIGWRRKHLGFINDENQMNVALTRAKQGLVIIGNQNLLRCNERWKELLTLYEETGCLKEARDYLSAGRR